MKATEVKQDRGDRRRSNLFRLTYNKHTGLFTLEETLASRVRCRIG